MANRIYKESWIKILQSIGTPLIFQRQMTLFRKTQDNMKDIQELPTCLHISLLFWDLRSDRYLCHQWWWRWYFIWRIDLLPLGTQYLQMPLFASLTVGTLMRRVQKNWKMEWIVRSLQNHPMRTHSTRPKGNDGGEIGTVLSSTFFVLQSLTSLFCCIYPVALIIYFCC